MAFEDDEKQSVFTEWAEAMTYEEEKELKRQHKLELKEKKKAEKEAAKAAKLAAKKASIDNKGGSDSETKDNTGETENSEEKTEGNTEADTEVDAEDNKVNLSKSENDASVETKSAEESAADTTVGTTVKTSGESSDESSSNESSSGDVSSDDSSSEGDEETQEGEETERSEEEDEYNDEDYNNPDYKKVKKKKKAEEINIVKELLSLIIYIGIVILICYFMIAYVGQRTTVNGSSMESTLFNGDQLWVDKFTYHFKDPERFDIIVFPYTQDEEVYYVKRIIGLPGEKIQIMPDGNIYINDNLLVESYGKEIILDSGIASEPIVLGEDEFFVMGDNRNDSRDSRWADVGNIKREKIVGRVAIRLAPFSSFGKVE